MSLPRVPGRRRAIPKPFVRPAIELSAVKRAWQNVPVETVERGDFVAGQGKVTSKSRAHERTRLYFPEGNSWQEDGTMVFAFTRARDGD